MTYTRACEIKPGVTFPEDMRRYALRVEYKGAEFRGFQKQASATETVQRYLEQALSFVADEAIVTKCAGRTDAGVNATAQWIHFDTLSDRDLVAWIKGVNSRMPRGIRVNYATRVDPLYHARFSAKARQYCYVLHRSNTPSSLLHELVTYLPYDVDLADMNQAAAHLIGEQDFSAFRASGCQAASPIRTITDAKWTAHGDFLAFHIKANAFLYHMVRNIVGSLLEVGRGVQAPKWVAELLVSRDRTLAAAKAPACGLYFVGVQYPAEFAIPADPILPAWLNA